MKIVKTALYVTKIQTYDIFFSKKVKVSNYGVYEETGSLLIQLRGSVQGHSLISCTLLNLVL